MKGSIKQGAGLLTSVIGGGVVFGVACALVLTTGCSPDSTGDDDGGESGDVSVAPDGVSLVDDASIVDVTVPALPRAFQVGMGVVSADLESEYVGAVWEFAEDNAEVLAIWIEGGLPWTEIVADESLPSSYEAYLADLSSRAAATGLDVLLVVDPLNSARNGLVADVSGGDAPAGFGESGVSEGYRRFCADLAARFQPRYFVPVLDLDLYAAQREIDYGALSVAYGQLREEVKFESAESRVFPAWDPVRLREELDNGNQGIEVILRELDDDSDRFGIVFHPAESFLEVDALVEDELEFLTEYVTRDLVVVSTGYPSRGFARGGSVFASSQSAQFNFLAWVMGEGDRLGIDLIVWRLPIDPDGWISSRCEGVDDCDTAVSDRHAAFEDYGLVTTAGDDKQAMRLWSEYAGRVFQD